MYIVDFVCPSIIYAPIKNLRNTPKYISSSRCIGWIQYIPIALAHGLVTKLSDSRKGCGYSYPFDYSPQKRPSNGPILI